MRQRKNSGYINSCLTPRQAQNKTFHNLNYKNINMCFTKKNKIKKKNVVVVDARKR